MDLKKFLAIVLSSLMLVSLTVPAEAATRAGKLGGYKASSLVNTRLVYKFNPYRQHVVGSPLAIQNEKSLVGFTRSATENIANLQLVRAFELKQLSKSTRSLHDLNSTYSYNERLRSAWALQQEKTLVGYNRFAPQKIAIQPFIDAVNLEYISGSTSSLRDLNSISPYLQKEKTVFLDPIKFVDNVGELRKPTTNDRRQKG